MHPDSYQKTVSFEKLASTYARPGTPGSVCKLVGEVWKRATETTNQKDNLIRVAVQTTDGWTATRVEEHVLPLFVCELAQEPDVLGFAVGSKRLNIIGM